MTFKSNGHIGSGGGFNSVGGFGVPSATELPFPPSLSPYFSCRADSVTVDGGNFISAFDDLAGNGNYFYQNTGTKQPLKTTSSNLNNKEVAYFDGIDDSLNSQLLWGNQNQTTVNIYAVIDSDTSTEDIMVMPNFHRTYIQGGVIKVRIQAADLSFSTYTFQGGVMTGIIRFRYELGGTDEYLHVSYNGSAEITATITGGFSSLVGSVTYGENQLIKQYAGGLAEFVGFHGSFSEADNTLMMNYLNSRYGL
jgi:hypothetical protein